MEAFRKQEKDVLVATDVASKGLDFPDIQHVINYDMPDDVENYGKELYINIKIFSLIEYKPLTKNLCIINFSNLFLVHRIGRTGRSGSKGLATTFINKSNDESVLLDLKHLLMEAKQKVPPFLAALCSESEKYLALGGNFYVTQILNGFKTFVFQENMVAVIVVVWAIELQIVQNWKLFKTNKPQTLEDVTI